MMKDRSLLNHDPFVPEVHDRAAECLLTERRASLDMCVIASKQHSCPLPLYFPYLLVTLHRTLPPSIVFLSLSISEEIDLADVACVADAGAGNVPAAKQPRFPLLC